jgi:integrase
VARIKRFHLPSCSGRDCGCLWVLDYRPLGTFGARRRLRFKTRKQAEQFQIETAHKASRGDYVDPVKVPTFREVAEDWFQSKTDRRPSHVADLRSRLDKHILPIFGPHRLDRITVAAVEKFRNDLRDQGYAHRTINTILRIMGAVFKKATRRGQCAKNPVDNVDRAVAAAREIRPGEEADGSGDEVHPDCILTPDEIGRLLEAATPGLWRTLIKTAFVSGARSGELLALRWTDLELPKQGPGKIAVRRSLSWARLKGEEIRPRFYPPKTKAGIRTIRIPAELVSELRHWKLQCPPAVDQLVFPAPDGGPMHRERLLRQGFYPALARARLRNVTFHSLRHSCASVLIKRGVALTDLQHHLGHANPVITLRVYSHWFRDGSDNSVADKLAQVMVDHLGSSAESEKSGHFVGSQGGQAVAAITVSA